MPGDSDRCGWHGSVTRFIDANKQAVLSQLYARYPAAALQEAAWASTLDQLQVFLQDYLSGRPDAGGWHLILEYQMPRARDRPLDVCLLTGSEVVVIEVKDTRSASVAAVDQLQGYLRDLQEYHEGSRRHSVVGMVLVTRAPETRRIEGTLVGNTEAVGNLLDGCDGEGISEQRAEAWMQARYEPLPSLIDAAVEIYQQNELPQIRTVQAAEIEETVDYVLSTAEQALSDGSHHLILLTGVPGSGKTLIGLQTTYRFTREHRPGPRGLFLSGNGPLIEVLQYQLESGVLVQNIHEFVSEYGASTEVPDEHFYIFDEAQRAWDRDHVIRTNKKKNRELPPESEPEMLMNILGRRDRGSCLVAVIGEGQSIYKGEQRGLDLWAEAVHAAETAWEVHASPRARPVFDESAEVRDHLHLDQTLRAHRATRLHEWIEALLEQRAETARARAEDLKDAGLWLRMTRSIDAGREHLKRIYQGSKTKTYGMVGSSKASNLGSYGVDLSYVGAHWLRPGQVGPWYVDKPGQPAKCRELIQAAQEFQCQGLELDGALVLWGRDLTLQEGRWVSRTKQVPGIHDPHTLRLNTYRILLSRGRDGIVIFVTPEPELDETAAHLEACGVDPLGEP